MCVCLFNVCMNIIIWNVLHLSDYRHEAKYIQGGRYIQSYHQKTQAQRIKNLCIQYTLTMLSQLITF